MTVFSVSTNCSGQQVGTGISREGIIALLLRAQSDIDKKLPDDDLRVMDDVVFHGAISTFDANREANADQVLKVCLKSLESDQQSWNTPSPNWTR